MEFVLPGPSFDPFVLQNAHSLLTPIFLLMLPVEFNRLSQALLETDLGLPANDAFDLGDISIVIPWFHFFSFLGKLCEGDLSRPCNLYDLLRQINEPDGNACSNIGYLSIGVIAQSHL